jgi:hypothetical protein
MWRTIIEWTARPGRSGDLELTMRTDGDRGIVTIDAITEDGRYRNNLEIKGTVATGEALKTVAVSRIAPGQYQSEFPLGGVGVNMLSLAWRDPETGAQGLATAAVTVPYAPEYRVFSANMPLLHEAATAAGGRILEGDASRDPIYAAAVEPLRSPLVLFGFIAAIASILFFIDVTVRRLIVRKADLQALAEGLKKGKEVERDDAVARLRAGKRTASPAAPLASNPLDTSSESGGEADIIVEAAPSPEISKPEQPSEEKMDDDDESSPPPSYTSRLLAAKKRNKSQ